MRERSKARGWALQVMYAWETRGESGSPTALLEQFANERNIASTSRVYAAQLLDAFATHRAQIHRELQDSLANWRLERLSMIDRNILRLAAAEMFYVDDVPDRVSIQEAIHLAEKYGTHESPRFVNGVLDALMRAHGSDTQESR